MKKEKTIQKDTVRLRKKQLKSGAYSLYLDIYVNGSRKYEFLKLYEKPVKKPEDRIENNNTRRAAEAIRSQRSLEIANGIAHLRNPSDSKILLLDWVDHYKEVKSQNPRGHSRWRLANNLRGHLKKYDGGKVRLVDVDKKFCLGFIKYLSKAKFLWTKSKDRRIKNSTGREYLNVLNVILNMAVKSELIPSNPLKLLSNEDKKPLMAPSPPRAYLTFEEIKMLASTPCYNEEFKRAFMFCCFTGLRISDLKDLVWSDIQRDNGRMFINKIIIKTQRLLYLPLSKEAVSWIPDIGDSKPDDHVFYIPANTYNINYHITRWAKAAGITKRITFHVARHTFATSLLTVGVDIYTTSKLLGHTDVKTTQIYAEIVNSKKSAAVDLLDGLSQVQPPA